MIGYAPISYQFLDFCDRQNPHYLIAVQNLNAAQSAISANDRSFDFQ